MARLESGTGTANEFRSGTTGDDPSGSVGDDPSGATGGDDRGGRLPPEQRRGDVDGGVVDDEVLRRVGARLPGHWTAKRRPVPEWVAGLAQRRAVEVLEPLAAAVRTVAGGRPAADPPDIDPPDTDAPGGRTIAGPTLGQVLDLLDAHRATELARALDPGGPETEADDRNARERLIDAICTLVGQALVAGGSARWAMGWAGPNRLVVTDARAEEIVLWVGTAVEDPTEVSWLRLHLASLGVAENTPVAVPVPPGRSRTITVTPALDEPTRARHRAIRNVSLTVMVGLLALGGFGWLTREPESPYPRRWQPQPEIQQTDRVRPYPQFTVRPYPGYSDLFPLPTGPIIPRNPGLPSHFPSLEPVPPRRR